MSTTTANLLPSLAESSPKTQEQVSAEKGMEKSYGQILKSSALIGGSSVLDIGIRVIRTKVMAILLGPAGFGLFGLYGSVADLTQSVAGMGINSSGVRQIAASVGSGEQRQIAQTATVLRRTSLALGLIGAILLVAFSKQVSSVTFGTSVHAGAISLLSLAVLLRLISDGQGALLQGMRRIADLAKMTVFGAICGTAIGIPIVYFFRDRGVVPSIIIVYGMTAITSWWYSRQIQLQSVSITFSQIGQEVRDLLKLGSAFMATGLMTMGYAYAVRVTILHKIGFEATGFYQAAWALGGLYVGFILQAMGADFYPRLTASANNNPECNRLVNEQTLIGMLLAGPGVLATLTFSPLVIALFYSAKFTAAVGVLRWICLGTTLRVITWPMGFVILAKGRQNLFFLADLAWTVVACGLVWICVARYGVNGAGMAFFGSYVFHGFMIYPLIGWLSGFRWSRANKETGTVFLALIALVFGGFYALPATVAYCLGGIVTVGSCVYSVRVVLKLVPLHELPAPVRRLLSRLGFAY